MGNDCTQNCSDNELFHLVMGVQDLMSQLMMEGVQGKAYTDESVFWWQVFWTPLLR